MSITTQVTALKASIDAALANALNKDEAIAAAAYAKALEALVNPGGVVDLVTEADTQVARVTTEGDTQDARISSLIEDVVVTSDITAETISGKVYVVTANATVTIPDDRPVGWRITFLTSTGAELIINEGNNTITGVSGAETPFLPERKTVTLRAVSQGTFEVY